MNLLDWSVSRSSGFLPRLQQSTAAHSFEATFQNRAFLEPLQRSIGSLVATVRLNTKSTFLTAFLAMPLNVLPATQTDVPQIVNIYFNTFQSPIVKKLKPNVPANRDWLLQKLSRDFEKPWTRFWKVVEGNEGESDGGPKNEIIAFAVGSAPHAKAEEEKWKEGKEEEQECPPDSDEAMFGTLFEKVAKEKKKVLGEEEQYWCKCNRVPVAKFVSCSPQSVQGCSSAGCFVLVSLLRVHLRFASKSRPVISTTRTSSSSPTPDLYIMATLPQHQRRGAASLLMTAFCKDADGTGHRSYLEASPKGKSTYERFGFEVKSTFSTLIDGEEYVNACMIREARKG